MRMNVLVFKMILAQCIGSRFTCLCSIALVTTASPEWSSTGALCFSGLLDFDSYFFFPEEGEIRSVNSSDIGNNHYEKKFGNLLS